jgi:NAD(P)-dependent dehydrogenase (short-subunit alcohol dehydrogenase family)
VATVVADVASDEGPDRIVAAALEAFGRIEILHNNVGVGLGDGPPHHLADEVYDRIMDVNLRAMWRTCRAAVPALRATGHGAIVNISSLAAIAAAGNLTAYKLSKAGVNALTQNLALTNAKHGVRANAIMPGFIDTPMGVDEPARALDADRAAYADLRGGMVPLGHQGTAWDVAHAALFLASDEAAFITGVVLPVDGGQSARVG